MDAPALLISDRVEERAGAALAEAWPGARVVLRGDDLDGDPAAVGVALFSGDLFPDRTRAFARALRDAPGLAWMHSFSAGVDDPWFQRLRARGVRLTTSSGAMAVPIAQTVILYLLALARDLPGWLDAQARRSWEPRDISDLQGRVLGVLGMGPIGQEVARLGGALRMRTLAVRRKPTGDEPCETWPWERLPELLGLADALVLALPLTDETRHLIDADALARMRPGALLVNVGRGEVVDETALVAALESGHLGGAGLDVFEVEPLPAESPLWGMPNVIVTPHSSGTNPGNQERVIELFLDNLARYRRGDPLRNEVA